MDISFLETEAMGQELAHFDLDDAQTLGRHLVELAQAAKAPVVINIRTPDRTLFHAALSGSAALNDVWARRKSSVALMFGAASMLIMLRMQAKGQTLERDGLANADFALSGGSIPIRVKGVGVVAAATMSGLPDQEDHRMVAKALAGLVQSQA